MDAHSADPVEHLVHALDALVARLGASPADVPAALASRTGRLKGAPIELAARAWHLPTLAAARGYTVRDTNGRVLLAEAILAPHDDVDAPILGVDAVRFGNRIAVFALDLHGHPAGVDVAGRHAVRGGPAPPPWQIELGTDGLVLAADPPRDAPDARSHAALCDATDDYLAAFEAVLTNAGAATRSGRAAGYLAAHHANLRGSRVFDALFGAEWAHAFLTTFLFPAVAA